MPYIDINTNVAISAEQSENIKFLCGQAISLIPGKSENYLMVKINDSAKLWFKGDDLPCAMCEVSIFGNASENSCEALTKELCNILEREADVPPDRVYVKFQPIETWGYNKFLF